MRFRRCVLREPSIPQWPCAVGWFAFNSRHPTLSEIPPCQPMRRSPIDDDASILQVFTNILSSRYRVSTLENVQACVDVLSRFAVDLAILDLNLLLVHRVKMIRKLRADSPLARPIRFSWFPPACLYSSNCKAQRFQTFRRNPLQ